MACGGLESGRARRAHPGEGGPYDPGPKETLASSKPQTQPYLAWEPLLSPPTPTPQGCQPCLAQETSYLQGCQLLTRFVPWHYLA